MSKARLKTAALLLAAIMLLPGCGDTGAAQENVPIAGESAGELITEKKAADGVFSVNYDPEKSLNPVRAESSTNMQLWSLMYDQVFTVNPDFSVGSEVVTSYTTEDNIWWVFNIDTSIKFSDGSSLTAADVAYSIRCAQQREYYAQRLSIIYGVSAMSEDCFAITTKYANSQLPALLNIPIIKNGSISESTPLGTGIYVLDESGERLVVSEHSRHAAEAPVDTIYLKSYTDVSEKISAFEDARLDIVTNDPTGMFNLGYGSSNETRYFDTTNLHYIGFNFTGTYFQTAQARYAVHYAIDRETIVDSYLGGCAVSATLPVHPTNSLYNADYASKFIYDIEKCSAMFTNANVKDHDGDGELEFLVTGIVIKPNINFIVNSDSTAKVLAARAIAEELNSIGIKTTLRELSWSDYITALEEGDYDMYYGEIRLTPDWNLAYMFEKDNEMNYANCGDEQLSALYYDYLAAGDATRAAAFDEACRYLTENAGIIPICFERRQVLTHRGVVSGISPTQYDLFNGICDWTIDLP